MPPTGDQHEAPRRGDINHADDHPRPRIRLLLLLRQRIPSQHLLSVLPVCTCVPPKKKERKAVVDVVLIILYEGQRHKFTTSFGRFPTKIVSNLCHGAVVQTDSNTIALVLYVHCAPFAYHRKKKVVRGRPVQLFFSGRSELKFGTIIPT